MKKKQSIGNEWNLSRRQVLRYAAMGGLSGIIGTGLSPLSYAGTPSASASNPIVEENRKPGTTDWQLTFVRSRNYRSADIEGYCSKTSVGHGESVDIFVSTGSDTAVTIDMYRMGYYGGKGGRLISSLGPFAVSPQPDPVIAEHRLRECRWERTTRLTIPEDWVSGVYLGKLSCEDHRYESYIIFVVRDDREADLLFQCSDTTWQAYNKWPDNYSLYESDEPWQPHSTRTRSSFDRPYGKYPQVVDQPLSQGSGEFLLWEYPLSFWLEKHGYDVTYCSNIDTHKDPEGLKRIKCFLSVGHDEYWTLDMFSNVKQAVDEGLNAAFLSGNSIMFAIDLKPNSAISSAMFDKRTGLTHAGHRVPVIFDPNGNPDRILYRTARFGGVSEAEEETGIMGPFTVDTPNENTLIGARTMYPFNGSADWIVSKEEHWIFDGTGLANGDKIPGLVGWEHHGDPADIPGLEVVAEGTTINSGGYESTYAATVYPGPKGNWVFNAATIFWSMGLSNPPGLIVPHSHHGSPHGVDERVQRITANFLIKSGARPNP
jgi:hypothetical protein